MKLWPSFIGWCVFALAWLIGCFAARSFDDFGRMPTHWAMAFGVAWVMVCAGLRHCTLLFIKDWRDGN